MGLNEAAGYGAVALTALATGFIAEQAGLRPEPFFLGVAFAGLGLTLSTLFVRETRGHARYEATAAHGPQPRSSTATLSTGEVFLLTSVTRAGARPRAARPGWSTTSTTASRGDCSRSSSPTPDSRSLASGSSPRSTPRSGASASSAPAHSRTESGASGSSPTGMWVQAGAIALIAATERLRCLGTRRRAPRCRHRDGVSDAARGGRRRRAPAMARARPSASTGSGATAASRSARSSPASSPMRSASRPRSGPSPP